ncbi:MAG: amidohydrolase [Bacillota bacterium]
MIEIDNNADLILYNAEIITLDQEREQAEKDHDFLDTIVIKDGKIAGTGKYKDLQDDLNRSMQRIDLRGKTVVPGFIDSHVHFMQTGLNRLFVDLLQVESREEMLAAIEAKVKETEPGEWIYGAGFDDNKYEGKKPPTRFEIDQVAPDNPVWMTRVDYHSCLMNSKAYEILDLEDELDQLEGFDRDSSGRFNGTVRDEANSLVRNRALDLIPNEMRLEAMEMATQEALQAGVTTVHSMEGGKLFSSKDVDVLLDKREENPLYIVVFEQTTNVSQALARGQKRIGGCIILDGSFGSRTSALLEPYTDDPSTRGKLYYTQDEVDEFIMEAHKAGLQATMHAIGDRAIEQLISAYEKAQAAYPRDDARHRIEHAELITDDQIKRASKLNLIISMQPAFEYFWGGLDGMYGIRLGEERAKNTNRYKDILAEGCYVTGGSDSDVTRMNPILGIHGAVNHSNPNNSVSVEEAMKFFTINAAYSVFEDDIKGTITPGKLANLTILDQNPYRVEPEKIKDIKVLETIIDGVTYYQNDK